MAVQRDDGATDSGAPSAAGSGSATSDLSNIDLSNIDASYVLTDGQNVLLPNGGVVPMSSGGPSWWGNFKFCMGGANLPIPPGWYAGLAAVVATVGAIQKAVAADPEITIEGLIAAGIFGPAAGDALVTAGALIASFYVGGVIGCVIAACISEIDFSRGPGIG
jgi:hypothetical protein